MSQLQSIRQNIWQQLTEAQTERKHPFRLATFATIHDTQPNIRTVVIRKVIRELNEIWFYTDFRSPKVTEIQNNHHVTWLFYHPIEQIQIRLYGNAQILHNQTINQTIWQDLPDYGKTDYLTKQAPGDSKLNAPTIFDESQNNQNFCIIKTTIHTMDWLQLSRQGHLRAKFELENKDWKGKWLVP